MPRVPLTVRKTLLIFLIGACLTLVSLRYVQPTNCSQFCVREPCKVGACKAGKQRAGFPFPFVRDQERNLGSSPTSGWGRVGVEDYIYPDIMAFSFNVLFYSAIVGSIFVLSKRLRM